jgi:hypothetical protein
LSITNNPLVSGTPYTLDVGKDSATGNLVIKVVLAEPAGGTFVTPNKPVWQPMGYQPFAAGTLASAQNLTVPTGATMAHIQVEVGSVRYRDDGTAPTAAIGSGRLMGAGGPSLLYTGNLAAIQFIQTAPGAVLDVLYYK